MFDYNVQLDLSAPDGELAAVQQTPTAFTSTAASLFGPKIRWSIPYWSFVIPLTLLSAWLLLSKPRAKTIRADSLT